MHTLERDFHALSQDEQFITAVGNIKAGFFQRDPNDPEYQSRLYYTEKLRQYVYDPATMNTILGDPDLKAMFFKTFGYPGQMRFTIYPNCWLRDLPLLEIGEDAYLADGILLGTNQVSRNQKTLKVGPISIGARTVFDQQCMVGLNTKIGIECVIGVRACIGLFCSIGDRVVINALSNVSHKVHIGDGVTVGYDCTIGAGSIVEDDVVIEDYTKVPQNSLVSRHGISTRKAVAS